METDGFLAEIERYRELDSEELLIEEVESVDESFEEDTTDSNRGYGGAFGSSVHAFDPTLASLHSHLGEVEDSQNRQSFLEGGAVLDIPLLYLEETVEMLICGADWARALYGLKRTSQKKQLKPVEIILYD